MKGLKNMNDQKRFGVIFSGGTAAGMNATLEYLCRYARKEGAKLIGFKYGWTGLIRNDTVEVTMKTTRGIAFEVGGTSLVSCSKVNDPTPAFLSSLPSWAICSALGICLLQTLFLQNTALSLQSGKPWRKANPKPLSLETVLSPQYPCMSWLS